MKDVRVPEQLQRAMAAEAEAAREARAKVIAAEGEHKASRSLRQAAEVIMDSPAALQVRITTIYFDFLVRRPLCYIIFKFPAPILANSEWNRCGAQQHHCLPGPHRHSLQLYAASASTSKPRSR